MIKEYQNQDKLKSRPFVPGLQVVTTKQKLLKEIKSVILVDTQMLNSQDAP
jgi:hypothetical protein